MDPFHASLFRSAPVALSLLDGEGRQVAANEEFRRLFGMDATGLLTSELLTDPADRDATKAALDDLRSGSVAAIDMEKRYVRPDGSVFWGRLRARALTDEEGGVVGLIGAIEDITDRRGAEEREHEALRRQATALDERTRMLAQVSHELRSPLHAIQGLAELLADGAAGDEERRLATMIHRESAALSGLVADLLDLSRLETGTFRIDAASFDPARTVRAVAELYRAEATRRGISLDVAIDDSAGMVVGDDRRVRQILVNLVDNALKFTQPDGSVRLTLDRSGTDAAGGGEAAVRFRVVDTGCGIPEEDLADVFRPFVQGGAGGREVGAGLGLSIASRLAEAMGGTLRVNSCAGAGSTFTLELPPVTGRSSGRAGAATPERPAAGGAASALAASPPISPDRRGRILVVEDSPVNQVLAAHQLRRLGQTHEIVGTGAEALEAVARERYDAVLMDWNLPDLDGLEVTRRLRDHERAIGLAPVPVIAVTANAMAGDRERCLAAGMDDFLAKPVTLRALADALARWVDVDATSPPAPAAVSPPPVGPASSDPAVDPEVFASFAADVGDPGVTRAVVETFLSELTPRQERLRTALAAGDHDAAARAAHVLRSASALLGASLLADLCVAIERPSATARPAALGAALDALVPRTARRMEELLAELLARG
jgi:PAS domain S-box-containing protein